MAKLCNSDGYSKAALACVILAVLCFLQVETSLLAATVDKKRSIALPVKSLKRTDNGPSYIAELRVLNAKYMTLACSVCRSYANHVKKQLKESSKTKPVDMEVTVGWRMDERKKINYHTSDSHLLDIFDEQRVCKTYNTTENMDQCDKYGLCTPVPIKGQMKQTIINTCKTFVELEEDSLTKWIRSDYIHEPNDDFKYCKTLNACKGREPPIRRNVKKKKKASRKQKMNVKKKGKKRIRREKRKQKEKRKIEKRKLRSSYCCERL